jgi:hypothetical protein
MFATTGTLVPQRSAEHARPATTSEGDEKTIKTTTTVPFIKGDEKNKCFSEGDEYTSKINNPPRLTATPPCKQRGEFKKNKILSLLDKRDNADERCLLMRTSAALVYKLQASLYCTRWYELCDDGNFSFPKECRAYEARQGEGVGE